MYKARNNLSGKKDGDDHEDSLLTLYEGLGFRVEAGWEHVADRVWDFLWVEAWGSCAWALGGNFEDDT